MRKYWNFFRSFDGLTSLIASIGAIFMKEYLEIAYKNQRILILFLTVSLALTIFILLTYSMRIIVKKSSVIKKMIFGANFIQGIWLDCIKNVEGEITGGGIIHINIQPTEIFVSGDIYTLNSTYCYKSGDFKSFISRFKNKKLEFSYYSSNRLQGFDYPGFSRYKFPISLKKSTIFVSEFFDSSNGKLQIGEAELVTDKNIVRKLCKSNHEERAQLLFEFLSTKNEKCHNYN